MLLKGSQKLILHMGFHFTSTLKIALLNFASKSINHSTWPDNQPQNKENILKIKWDSLTDIIIETQNPTSSLYIIFTGSF